MPLSSIDRRKLTANLVPVMREAGAKIMDIYASDFSVTEKADKSPVTQADACAEAIILGQLSVLAPGIPVIAEEAHAAGKRVQPGHTFFLVDPLDGTREFINRRDEFTVNIGLIENGLPTMGLIFAPALGRLFCASGVGEAVEISANDVASPISVRQTPQDGRIAVVSRSHRDPATEAYLAKQGITEFISAGSSLKFCLLAAGEADIYPRTGPTCEWDICAGHAILLAARGGLSRLDGQPFVYGKAEENFLNPGFLAWGGGEPAPPV